MIKKEILYKQIHFLDLEIIFSNLTAFDQLLLISSLSTPAGEPGQVFFNLPPCRLGGSVACLAIKNTSPVVNLNISVN